MSKQNMGRWWDTHCHLDLEPLSLNLNRVLERSHQAGVERILVPAVSGSIQRLPTIPGVRFAWGVHPQHAASWTPQSIRREVSATTYNMVAIGEIGLDKHVDVSFEQQALVFAEQARIAREKGLPILVHLRGFLVEALAILQREASGVPWIMHSFSGTRETARAFLEAGAYLSFAGALTKPNAKKAVDVLRRMPPERLLLETDAPDQSPAFWPRPPHHEPVTIAGIGVAASRILKMPWRDLAEQVWKNSSELFPAWQDSLGSHFSA